jgi:hypothetical protein
MEYLAGYFLRELGTDIPVLLVYARERLDPELTGSPFILPSPAHLQNLLTRRPSLSPTCFRYRQLAIMSCIETVTQQPEITAENVLRLFPEVNTALIGGSHDSATSDNALQGYDEEQIRLMDEVCIVLDNDDVPIGSATKKLCM